MIKRYRIHALYFFIFLSGIARLGYEMVWTRMFSLALGHEIVAVLAVVAGFFSGLALGMNTLGAAFAPLLFGLILLPAWGSKTTLLLLSLGYLLLLPRGVFGKRLPGTMLPLMVALGLFLVPLQLRFVTVPSGGELVEYRDGVMAAVSMVRDARDGLHLKINDRFQMGGTGSAYSDRRQAHLPLLLHPNPQRALLLGLGTGITFAAAADYPGLQADGVELVPEIIPMLSYFTRAQGAALQDPRLGIHVADARRFVSASRQRYDVIIADLFHPARDGAGFLYTVEHFATVRELLAEDGLFCQWLPLYQLDLDTLRSIVRSYLEVFPEASSYLAHFSLQVPIIGLVSGTPSGGYPADWLASRMPDKRMDRVLTELRLEDIYDLFGHYLAGSRELGEFASGAPINRDDHPYVIFQAPHFAYNDPQPVYVRLLKLVDRFRPDPAEVLAAQSGAAVNLNYPKIAQHDCSDSRLGKGRIAILCNPYRNAEAGQSGKQDGIIYFFRGPKFPPWSEWPIKPGSSRLALLSQWLSSCLGGRC